MGKYHPHGDAPIYDSLVRMAQPFNMRYPLVEGQGNFGSVDGDPPAAQRYTEARLSRVATALIEDIDKETVDFRPNYDDSEVEPEVLPTRVPNLLINGSEGHRGRHGDQDSAAQSDRNRQRNHCAGQRSNNPAGRNYEAGSRSRISPQAAPFWAGREFSTPSCADAAACEFARKRLSSQWVKTANASW